MKPWAAVLALAILASCSNREVHVFSAWQFDIDRDCLEPPAVVDVLDGPDNGPCKQIRCWESADHKTYVTDTACDAPPDFKDETKDPTSPCVEALKVYGRDQHGVCPTGAGGGGGAGTVP